MVMLQSRLFVRALTFEILDLETSFLVCSHNFRLSASFVCQGHWVKVKVTLTGTETDIYDSDIFVNGNRNKNENYLQNENEIETIINDAKTK